MKKTLAVVATLAMTAALSMTAFAEDHVPSIPSDVTLEHEGEETNFEEGKWKKEPTCTEDGIWRYECGVTPGTFHEVIIPALGHTWSSEVDGREWGKVTVEPTCTEEGEAIDYCKECGEENPDNTRVLEKVPHEWKQVQDEHTFEKATCVSDGKEVSLYHNECKNCGEVQTDDDGEMIVIAPEKENSTWKWTNPGDKADSKNEPHKWVDWTVEEEATCTKEGSEIRWCTVCGIKQERTIAKLKPQWKQKSSKMLNCYEEEITYTCANCDGKNPDHNKVEVKDVKSHTWATKPDKTLSKAPTCTTWGYSVYPCTHVNTGDSDEHKHTDVVRTVKKTNEELGKAYTITVKELDGYKYEYVEPKHHQFGEWVKRNTSNGTTYWIRTCKVCKATEETITQGDTKPTTDPVYPSVKKNGFVEDEDGVWRLYKDDKVDETFTGIYEYNGGEFYLEKGVLQNKANGLNLVKGTWYFLAQGQVQRKDGFAEYDKNWFMIDNGELDKDANGLYSYDGGVFLFAAGRLRTDVNGLWQDHYGTYGPADTWYFLANGQVVDFTGVAEYNGSFFVVEKGVFNNSYNGTIEYDGATFNVVNGQLYDQVAKEAA